MFLSSLGLGTGCFLKRKACPDLEPTPHAPRVRSALSSQLTATGSTAVHFSSFRFFAGTPINNFNCKIKGEKIKDMPIIDGKTMKLYYL